MAENLKKDTSNNKKSQKIIVGIIIAVLLVLAVLVGLYASGILGGQKSTDTATETDADTDVIHIVTQEVKDKASNVTDEATLRELLLMNCTLDITVTEDIEISETMIVNGKKTVTSKNTLSATFDMEGGTPLLDVSKKASLTVDGWNMYGSGLASGVNVNLYGTFNYKSGKMEYMGTYGVVANGTVNLSEDVEIAHTGSGAMNAALEGVINVAGGTYKDAGTNLVNVEKGGSLNVTGKPLFDGAVNHLVYNYGETVINGGTFLNSGYRGIANYAKITMEYKGDDENGYIEVGNTANVAVYTSSAFRSYYKGVYAHDAAGGNLFLQSNRTTKCTVEDSIFDTCEGNAVSIRGEVYFTNVTVKNATKSLVYIQQNCNATLNNIILDNSIGGRGITINSSTLKGSNIEVSNTKGIGIAAESTEQFGTSTVELSDVYLHDIQGNGIKVMGDSTMKFKDSVFEKSKRTNVYADNGSITLDSVQVLGTLDNGICAVQIQPKGNITMTGKSVITGSTMRAVGVYGGKFTMKNGIIRDNSASETGAGVHITKVKDSVGTFKMSGGVICNNVTANKSKNAGGVNVSSDAVFIMTGGKIYGNSTSGIGGGVRVAENATFTMSGGEIYQNEAKQGAGVQLDKGSIFNMKGGSIYKNKAKASGAGVYVAGTFNMSGGEIHSNVAGSFGGAMNIVATTDNKTKEITHVGTFNMTGGKLYGNYAVSGGGAIQASGNSVANLSGGRVENNDTAGIGDGIRVSGKVTISDAFYMTNDRAAVSGKGVVVNVKGNTLKNHSTKDPLLVSAADDSTSGTKVVKCDSNDAAASILTCTASGNGSFLLAQKDEHLVVNYAVADMDMTGADKVYVSNFQQLKEAVTSTTSKRYIILTADIEMESAIKVPNGTTVYIRDDGVQRTLSRAEDVTSSFFTTSYGTGLYIVATEEGKLVLDGELSKDAKASKVSSLLTTQGGTVIDGVTFVNNGSKENEGLLGAFIYQKYGHIDMYDSTFSGAEGASGAVGFGASATGYAENCAFTDNTVKNGGGAIRLEKNAEFEAKNCSFENNTAGTSGGAIVNESATFIAIDCDFKNNTAGNNGGVIKSNNGTAKFLDEDGKMNYIVSNASGNAGGAIWAKGTLITDMYSFEMNKTKNEKTFDDKDTKENEANNVSGGAVYVEGSTSYIEVTDSSFSNNASKYQGGAVDLNAGSVTISGTSFLKNSSVADGGAIRSVTALTLADCEFDFNTAGSSAKNAQGGAIYMTGSASFANDSVNNSFEGNKAPQGGAVGYNSSAESNVENWSFKNNEAIVVVTQDKDGKDVYEQGNGGAITAKKGSFKLENGNLTGNVARNGGAVMVEASATVETTGVTFDGNYTNGNTAGAVYVGGAYVDNGSTFQNNKACDANGNAVKNGGAMYLNASTSKATLTNSVFTNNQAKDGGAIRITAGTIDAEGCTFTGNKAVTEEGGAINMVADYTNVVVNLKGTNTFSGNTAAKTGGAIQIGGDANDAEKTDDDLTSTLNVTGTVVFNNANTATMGGAIYVENKLAIVDIDSDGNFTGNVATTADNTGKGGAIYVAASTADSVKIKGVTFAQNSARDGGAIFIPSGVTVTTEDATFDGNYTTNNCAAAVYVSGTYVDNGSTFQNNKACDVNGTVNKNGGAVYVNVATAKATLTGSTFIGNQAKDGGAIRINKGELNLDGCTFTGNIATTEEGGAINMAADGGNVVVNLTGTNTFSGNTATNATNGKGGAIFLGGSGDYTAELNVGGEVVFNNANTAIYGGVIYVNDAKATVNLTGTGSFNGNTANEGGAIYVAGGNLYISKDSEATGATYTFANNTATLNGAAIYTKSTNNVVINKANFENNKAYGSGKTSGKGAGVYIAATSADGVQVTKCNFTGNQVSGEGGALYHNDGMLYVTDCNFTNNVSSADGEGFIVANGNGGAIYLRGDAEALITATEAGKYSFTGNTADRGSSTYTWGAIASNSTGEVRYSAKYTFENNTHETYGKLGIGCGIHGDGKVLIRMAEADSYATLNTAVSNAGTKEVTEITLLGNIAMESRIDCSGKNIVMSNKEGTDVTISLADSFPTADGSRTNMFKTASGTTLTIQGADAKSRTGITLDGGNKTSASLLYGDGGNLTVKNATLKNAGATKSNGGAIQLKNSGTLTVDNCLFTSNASGQGGAIYLTGAVDGAISNTDFEGNSAINQGGAIDTNTSGTVAIANCNFTGNTAKKDGGAIRVYDSCTLDVIDCNFTNNAAAYQRTSGGNGGAIYATGSSNVLVITAETGKYSFKGNTAYRGANGYIWGAIATNSSGDVRYSAKYTFENNTHENADDLGTGCGIHAEGKVLIRMDEAASYDALKAAINNGGTKETTEVTLTDNIAFTGRIDCSGKNVTLINKEGTDVTLSLADSFPTADGKRTNMFKTASGTTLTIEGADVNSRTGITIDGGNKMSAALLYGDGGNLTVRNATLKQAGATKSNGGAIQLKNSGTLTVDNCLFTSNASNYGGAIYLLGTVGGTIFNTDFEGNTANEQGGAIYTNSTAEAGLTITDCNFGTAVSGVYSNGNTAKIGGAIYNASTAITIKNSNFYDNEATTNTSKTAYGGGAICQVGGSSTITGSGEFAGNTTGWQGGAIYTNSGSLIISGYDFIANSGRDGGALRVRDNTGNTTDNELRIENCDFLNNSAICTGGAMYVSAAPSGGNSKVILAGTGKFSGNTCGSSYYGSAIGLGAKSGSTTLSVYYEDSSASYTFDNQTVQNSDKVNYTINVE